MAKPLAIVKYPQALLRRKAKPVSHITKETLSLLGRMERTMEAREGVGLAAPQVGVSQQLIVVKLGKKTHAFLNPAIVKKSKAQISDQEGCLSIPGIFVKVKRAHGIELAAQTPKGRFVKIVAQGLAARIFQHEIDHLNGILIIHRINPLARFRLMRKYARQKSH